MTISYSTVTCWQLPKSNLINVSVLWLLWWLWGRGLRDRGVIRRNMGVSVTVVVKITLKWTKKLDSDLYKKSCREETALILGIHSCCQEVRADLASRWMTDAIYYHLSLSSFPKTERGNTRERLMDWKINLKLL